MHALSAWFTRNPVAANLLMALIIIAGVFTLMSIRIEGFPALPPSSISVTTVYPGASAEQVDRGISRKIEKALEGMPGVKKIISFSEEGVSSVTVQKTSKFDMDRFQNEIQSRVDSIFNMPKLAERPIITRDEFNVEALLVQVYGDTDEKTLQKVSRQVREELLAEPKIVKLDSFGLLSHEIRVEVDDDKLRAHGLSLEDVGRAIDSASLDYRTGTIESQAGKVVIRADHKAFDYEDFVSIPILTHSDGTRLLIGDVARVIDGFEEESLFARFQGKTSVGLQVYTSKKGHLMEVSEAAREVVNRVRPQLPKGVEIDIWGEYSVYMKDRLSLLATNAWMGLLIVFCLLALFLNLKLAFWVAMGIPISLAGAVALMGDRFLGYSLNDITTFGMIIVLGILVDDAVVVGESVFEQRSKNSDPIQGTINGVHRVSTATIFGCFTTVAAFYPLMLIDNDLGKVFASFAVVVIVALIISMLESKLILPAHLAAIRMNDGSPRGLLSRAWGRVQSVFAGALSLANRRLYQPLLSLVLKRRYSSLVVFITLAVCGISLIFNGWVRTVFFPDVPGQIISVEMDLKSGSPESLTKANINAIEAAAWEINDQAMVEFKTDEPPIVHIMSGQTGPHSAIFFAELQPEKKRKIETMETLRRWREQVGVLEGVEKLSFSGSFETGGGFVVELKARDEAVLEDAVERFTLALKQLEGVHDVRDDLNQGSPLIRLHLKPEAHHLGLTTADLASQIGNAFGGLEIQRLQRKANEVVVNVKYQKDRRRYMQDILDTRILTSQQTWVPLSLVATIKTGYEPSTLYRQNGKRVVQVLATLDKDVVSPSEAFAWIKTDVWPELSALYPSLSMSGGGELEEMGEMRGGLRRALIMILILIYALLAVPLKSYWQPLVIMSVIPFGFVGAVLGHKIMDAPFSVLSFFGMLAAMGVVVNDSLVMLTRFNQIREEGLPLREALVKAGSSRFRAIVLTTVTTVCGVMPLLFEGSEQAQYLIPAAISLAWGELFATPITLFVIPLLISLINDGFAVVKRTWSFVAPQGLDPVPAKGVQHD